MSEIGQLTQASFYRRLATGAIVAQMAWDRFHEARLSNQSAESFAEISAQIVSSTLRLYRQFAATIQDSDNVFDVSTGLKIAVTTILEGRQFCSQEMWSRDEVYRSS